MTDEKKKALLSVLDGMDVSEVISLLIMSGNSYSRRLLKFIKWITKWLPICIMVWHSFAMLDFSQNPREMFIVHSEHWPSYTFIYVLLYVLPLVLILFSRFFWLCWVYRIPFFYYFGVNAIHLTYWSVVYYKRYGNVMYVCNSNDRSILLILGNRLVLNKNKDR